MERGRIWLLALLALLLTASAVRADEINAFLDNRPTIPALRDRNDQRLGVCDERCFRNCLSAY